MTQYQSPGVYVEEVPSAIQPIAGVGTSTAGFIGVITKDSIEIPRPNPDYDPTKGKVKKEDGKEVDLKPEKLLGWTLVEEVANSEVEEVILNKNEKLTEDVAKKLRTRWIPPITVWSKKKVNELLADAVLAEDVKDKNDEVITFRIGQDEKQLTKDHEIKEAEVEPIKAAIEKELGKNEAKKLEIKVKETVQDLQKLKGDYLKDKFLAERVVLPKIEGKTLKAGTFVKDEKMAIQIIAAKRKGKTKIKVQNLPYLIETFSFGKNDAAKDGEVKLCTNFGQFKKYFGDFSNDSDQSNLAHAVYGFFNNGGTRCYVVREKSTAEIAGSALKKFEAIDEIAIVTAPGRTDDGVRSDIVTHCKTHTQDRFAIFDGAENDDPANLSQNLPANSDYSAYYVPWLQVFDPATKVMEPKGDGLKYVPPSGHIAGIYARVDTNRGVHKAPANETVLGALGLKYAISKAHQMGLNPKGVNCIRNLNSNITVWGARTIGGDQNTEWKYINVRRLFLYLRESIDKGTQWVVFEPNTPELWAKITRNITAFLTNVWRDGALFGNTPQEAFYVKCDAEINPPEVRDLGRVVTEIGVAVVKPAEFVIFRISQWAGPGE